MGNSSPRRYTSEPKRLRSLARVPSPDEFTTYLLDVLAPLGPVSARRMFGGVGLYHGGMMFGLIAREELFFKVGDANRPAFEAAGEAPFTYATKNGAHTLQSFWHCPAELLDDPEALNAWARQAVDAAMMAAQAKPKPTGKQGGARLMIDADAGAVRKRVRKR